MTRHLQDFTAGGVSVIVTGGTVFAVYGMSFNSN